MSSFISKSRGDLAGRIGEFSLGSKKLQTPYYFPVINIMTGPPPIFRTGGMWKGIKRELIGGEKITAFMTQILHFIDYNISKNQLDLWLEKPLHKWIHEEVGYEPIIFADSGGYKLLFSDGIDTSKFDISAVPKDILMLQLKIGSNILASLDYPVQSTLSVGEIKQRKEKSIRNAILCLKLIEEQELKDEFIFLPVHGLDFSSSFNYTQNLLEEIQNNNLDYNNFGLAIGSLVPLSSNYTKIIDITAGVIKGVREFRDIDHTRIPIHVFGISSIIIPFLMVMGVDCFDSTAYAQAAQRLRYFDRIGSSGKEFLFLKKLSCDCRYCQEMKRYSLSKVQEVLKSEAYKKYEINGEEVIKSKFYSLIACHNFDFMRKKFIEITEAISQGREIEFLLEKYSKTNQMKQILGGLIKYYDNFSETLLKYTMFPITRDKVTFTNIKFKPVNRIASPAKKTITTSEKIITLDHNPNDFNILTREYQPKHDILLLAQCSKMKPYSSSRTFRALKQTVIRVKGGIERIEFVIFSGLYGPVPLKYEKDQAVIGYDYRLHSSNIKQINLLKKRLKKFLNVYKKDFSNMVVYTTSNAYRKTIEDLKKDFKNLEILPRNLRRRTLSEYTKKDNLLQLELFLRRVIDNEEKNEKPKL